MKTQETIALETAIKKATSKMGTFGCFEVTIGYCGKERVDYMTYDTKGIFRCYEIKVTKADFHSPAAKTFAGHYNYYVLTKELYDQVKDEIPDEIGIYIQDQCIKKAKRQDISKMEYKMHRTINGRSTEVSISWTDMLKDSMIRSLYRDSDKSFKAENIQYVEKLKREVNTAKRERDTEARRYRWLWKIVREEFGEEKALDLIKKSERSMQQKTLKNE